MATIRITSSADRRKSGWWKVGAVVRDDPFQEPSEAYAIAQFRHKGDAWNYAKQLRVPQTTDEILIF